MQDDIPPSVEGNRLRWLFAGIAILLVVLVLLLPPVSILGRLSARKGAPTPKALPSPPPASPKAAMLATSTPLPQPSPATATKAVPTPTPQLPAASPTPLTPRTSPALEPTPTPVPKATQPATTPTPPATATRAPSPTPQPGGVVNSAVGLWLRTGPGVGYPTLKLLPDGRALEVLGQAPDDGRCGGVWLQVVTTEGKGWVCSTYVKLNISLKDIPVSKEIPPTPTPAPTPTRTATPSASPTPGGAPTPTLPPPPPPGPAPSGFGYGIQVDLSYGDPGPVLDRVAGLGFNWFKIQVPWFHHEPAKGSYQWDQLDKVVSAAQARRLNVLFSVVKAPRWSRSSQEEEGPPDNYAHYADFMRALATRYRGRVQAYEVWNEQNLRREWNTGRPWQIDGTNARDYVELLKVAYNTIKSVDPGAIVVSGGPTPTGLTGCVPGTQPLACAIDDALYLEQMYQAGLRSYCDAVGVHPSGYNVPSWVDLERDRGYTDPTASFRGPFDGGSAYHRSWSYQSTMRRYREIMTTYGDGAKKLWPTEFGWASAQNLPPAPISLQIYPYIVDNTEAEQAQFLVKAFELARQWGYVGVMFVWELNFGMTHSPATDSHAFGAFGILRPDGSARPSYAGLRDMPK